jgi:hypothetical protein
VIYDLYSIEPSLDSAQVRLPVWPEQSHGALEVTWRVIQAPQSPRHFRQPHSSPFALDSTPVSADNLNPAIHISSRTADLMKDQLPSLITPHSQAGLTLACKLADELHAQLDQANSKVERPGGMNFLLPPAVPKEITSSILFYAIAAANCGWAGKA